MGADGEVLGVFEEALAGGILPQAVGEAGHGVEPAPVDGEGAHTVESRGLAIDGAGGRPGGAPGELVLADLVGGERGDPRLAAEHRRRPGSVACLFSDMLSMDRQSAGGFTEIPRAPATRPAFGRSASSLLSSLLLSVHSSDIGGIRASLAFLP